MNTCSLCEIQLDHLPHRDGEHFFCCQGCLLVFSILMRKKEKIDNVLDSDLFKRAVSAGLISNPHLIEKIKGKTFSEADEVKRLHLEISEMWCPACSEVIQLILLQEKGVKTCVVDYATDFCSIEFFPRYISKEKIFSLIAQFGYQAHLIEDRNRKVSGILSLRFIVAAFCSLNIMMLFSPLYATYFHDDKEHFGTLFAYLSLLLSLPVLLFSAYPIFKRFFTALICGLYGMEALVTLGVASSFFLSLYSLYEGSNYVYFDSMCVIVTFVLLGKIIETKAKFSAKESIFQLEAKLPKRGRKLLEDGASEFVPIKEIQRGDTLMVYSGEKIVLDGVVVEGEGFSDESLMTGESLPVKKEKGSTLVSGTILLQGYLKYCVTKESDKSTLYQLLEVAKEDLSHKSVYVRAVDPIVRYFVPTIILLSAITGVLSYLLYGLHEALIRSISVLLISCPCAIGIAAPLAESSILNRLALMGVIVRNRGVLNLLGKETVTVFDKTGTITEGKFEVLNSLDDLTLLEKSLVKSLSQHSTHPVSQAISNVILEKPVDLTHIQEVAGMGIKAFYQGEKIILGSKKFLESEGVFFTIDSEDESSHCHFAINHRVITTFILGDRIKKEALTLLKETRTILLSGDREACVKKVSLQCGFHEWKASVTPLEKRAFIEKLKGKGEVVCMVGDGINDAPSLSCADIGISVVSASDISIQVSDILLTTDNLKLISKIRAIAKKGRTIIHQNLFWAFFYNVIGIFLAVFGLLNPIVAAIAMVLSSFIVLMNARRI